MKQKYQRKDTYLQKKDNKLLMNQNQYNNIITEYQKIINLLDNTPNQPSKFRRKNWFEINDESRGTYNVNSQTKFKNTMEKSSLSDYSDAYILVKGTITVDDTSAAGAAANNTNKKVLYKDHLRYKTIFCYKVAFDL